MRKGPVISLVLGSGLLASQALAQVDKKLQAGAALEILPVGDLTFEGGGVSASGSTAVAFGIAPFFDYAAGPNLSIGFGPRLLLNVRGEDNDKAAKQLDLRARVMARFPAGSQKKMQIYAYVAPGYSVIYPPDWPDELDSPAGLVLALAGGATYDFSPDAFVMFELGYQLGWQEVSEQGVSFDLSDNYLHLGAGVGTRF